MQNNQKEENIMSIQSLHHICIQTNQYKDSLEFYTKMLDFRIIEETPDFHGREYNTWLTNDILMIELQTGKGEHALSAINQEHEGIAHICFLTDNIEEEVIRLEQRGFTGFKKKNGEIVYQVNQGKLFKIISPEGTVIEYRDSQDI
ncbi:VOC family protein [Anaeromicropila herbilytica]|uniref:VOC domain-containing protein n=1 Tax=Anaeromicropila herbilytica TaxID=2785025 RepID=A0A7R7IE78_9FIRM|nr:VOC family protein [Anaeromicropila herbilytica]BCN32347.1 hypothetical protein bsdtb5_36420 [Anaeromicropila herbilytica]